MARFGAEAIHNFDNVVAIPAQLNNKINGFYSQPFYEITRSKTLTVREWLATKSLQQNYDFGRIALVMVDAGVWK